MDLIQIRYFLALAKTLNFTRAAEACNVTQPALTKSIQRLEGELGGPLLLRERNHTQLTPLGSAMLPLLQQTFDAAEIARASAQQFRKQGSPRFHLGIGPWVEPTVVAPLIQQVAQRFPNVELTIRHGDIGALNDWLLASEIDVTLTVDAERLTERANRWAMFADPIVALLPQQHALASAGPMVAETLVQFLSVGCLSGELEQRYPVKLPLRYRGATEGQLHTLVLAGTGLALSTARRPVPPGIVRRAIEPSQALDVFVAAIAGRTMSPAAGAFLRLARARDWSEEPAG